MSFAKSTVQQMLEAWDILIAQARPPDGLDMIFNTGSTNIPQDITNMDTVYTYAENHPP